jgi:UDP-N-acetylmuramyl pentapeptide phosphotransferase/UDP-N-acetylglucosamine-1-phosphate transferase
MIELYSITYYILIVLFLIGGMIGYLKLAEKWSITDKPNSRSSHNYITKRGGGVLYLLGFIIYLYFSEFNNQFIITTAFLLGTIGFIDDIKNLNFKIKLLLQVIILSVFIISQNYLLLEWYVIFLIFLFILGSINTYNFMDGINGLTILYSLSFLISFLLINNYFIDFTDNNLLLILIICNLIIGVFNVRKQAICFLGDVGPISMGFIFSILCVTLIIKSNDFSPLILFMIYGIDSGWTIVQRVIAKENIFLPHRKHLYQLLVNEYQFPHLRVSFIYFMVQITLNLIWLLNYKNGNSMNIFIISFILLSFIYLMVKRKMINNLKEIKV